jgi:hypothetical protein
MLTVIQPQAIHPSPRLRADALAPDELAVYRKVCAAGPRGLLTACPVERSLLWWLYLLGFVYETDRADGTVVYRAVV